MKEKAARISVTVPMDLYKERMKPLKKKLKSSFNYSQIFQDAVKEAIERHESFQERMKKDLPRAEIVERLKAEKAESKVNWFEKGKIDGLEWAKRAHYEEIQLVAYPGPQASRIKIPRQELNQFNPGFSSYLSDCTEKIMAEAGEKPAGRLLKYRVASVNSWEQGWMQGVNDFWNEIFAEVEEWPVAPPPPPPKKTKK